jgi:16S rRNA processing protein RimM
MSDSFILIGQFGGVWGLRGELKVISWSTPRENIFSYNPWYVCDEKIKQPTEEDLIDYQVANHRVLRSGRSLSVDLMGIDSVEQAQLLQGKKIYIAREQLPSLKDEYYWDELIGMSVINAQEMPLGKVVEVLSTGVHDVLKVRQEIGDKTTYLIPYIHNRFVLSVDRKLRQIEVDWDVSWVT